MNTLFVSLLLSFLVFTSPSVIFAASDNAQQQGNTNTIQVQNQGEDQQLEVANQQQQQEPNDATTGGRKSDVSIANRGATASEHLSIVAQQVDNLLSFPDRRGGIGDQVRVIAQEQEQIQERVRESLEQLENRPRFMVKLFGPNYKAINRLQATIEQNEQLVEELLILQENALYPAEKEDLGSAITALEQQNTLLFQQIQLSSGDNGFLGWVFRFFSQSAPTYGSI